MYDYSSRSTFSVIKMVRYCWTGGSLGYEESKKSTPPFWGGGVLFIVEMNPFYLGDTLENLVVPDLLVRDTT